MSPHLLLSPLLNHLLLLLDEHFATTFLLDTHAGSTKDDQDVDCHQQDGREDERFANGLSCLELMNHVVEEDNVVAEHQEEVLVECLKVPQCARRVQEVVVDIT